MASKRTLTECMAVIEDPRVDRTKYHDLLDILVLSVLAVMCGAEGWEDIENFGKIRKSWLKQFIKLKHGIPSHDTISRVFRMLKPEAFQAAFREWLIEMDLMGGADVIAIDGKSLRRSHDGVFKKMLHSVSAWSVANNVMLGQQAVDEKSNEITAIPLLLKTLQLKGAIITIDAMGCQKEIAQQIHDGGGDYVLALKDNQPLLFEATQQHFVDAHQTEEPTTQVRQHTTVEKGHGRVESRQYFHSPIPANIRHLFVDWPGAKTIGQAINVIERDGKETSEVRYFVSSLDVGVKKFASAVRGHWSIENKLHWTLDVTFNEDQSRIRKDHGAENFALLRRYVLSIVKLDTSKGSMRSKRKMAAWSEDYLLSLLKNVV
jgi:predicted transposase YbfD/YdcC